MVENAIFLQQQKSKSHRKYIFSPAKQIYNFIPQFRNTNKTQEKKKSYSGQIERRRKRRRTIGFRVEDDRFWGATIAIEDDESGFAIGDDESVLRLRSRSARRRSRTAKSKAKSNGEVEVEQLCALGSISFWVRSLWPELGWSEGCALSLSLFPLSHSHSALSLSLFSGKLYLKVK